MGVAVFGRRKEQKALQKLEAALGGAVEIYAQVPCEFRSQMAGHLPRVWGRGFAAISSQGLHAYEPGKSLYSMDWSMIRYLNPHLRIPLGFLSATGFDGSVMQIRLTQDVPLRQQAFALWSTLEGFTWQDEGMEVEFRPGGHDLNAVLGFEGEWAGGLPQVRDRVKNFSARAQSKLTARDILDIDAVNAIVLDRAGEFDQGDEVSQSEFWRRRTDRLIQSETFLADQAYADLDVISTAGAVLDNQARESLFGCELAIVEGRELWVMYFPLQSSEFWWPSVGLWKMMMPHPGDPTTFVARSERDLRPSPMVIYDLTQMSGSLRTSIFEDGRGPLLIQTPPDGSGIVASNMELETVMPLGIAGKEGWQAFRDALNEAVPGISEAF